jgi:hypothetical protein
MCNVISTAVINLYIQHMNMKQARFGMSSIDLEQTFVLSLRVISETSISCMPVFRATFYPGIYLIQKIGCNSPSVLTSILRN